MKRSLVLAAAGALAVAAAHAEFRLQSPEIRAGATIPQKFEADVSGCKGQNRSPALRWSGAPKGTRGFALTVFDPDAPTGAGWWHWVVLDMPRTVHALPAGGGNANGANLPRGAIQLHNDYGSAGWGGPCPPAGDKPHRYVFTVYALKSDRLDLAADAKPADAKAAIEAAALGQASFTASYGRPKGP
jgi:Raf kinase inhibitor-like YbhB/YbcL family protein